MAYKISDACVNCGICAEFCPADAISDGGDKYVIDAEKCTNCGVCSDTCIAGAVEAE